MLRRFVLFFTLGAFALFGAGNAVVAQTAPIPQVVVINSQLILEQSKAAKSLQVQLNDANQTNEAAIGPKRADIEARQTKLAQDRPTLSAEDYQARAATLQTDIDAFRQEVATRRSTLEGKMSEAMSQTRVRLQEVVLEIAGERAANLVLERGAVVLMAPQFDITQEVLQRLDEKYPSATLQ